MPWARGGRSIRPPRSSPLPGPRRRARVRGRRMAFRTSVPVRFGDVDHAGIVFYPKFFVYFHEAFERFFDDARITYERLIAERRIGFPTVHIDCDYLAPLRY